MANLVEIPSCGICTLEYDDNVVPKILTDCGHTVCEQCTRTMWKNGQIECPFDKQLTTCRDPSKLQKNFSIAALADEFRRGELGQTPHNQEKRFVELCHENPKHVATVFCEDCRADLCNECFNEIHSFNLMKHHMKNQLDDRLEQDTNCPIHRHLEVKFACMSNICTARYRLGCRWCFANGEHKEHCHVKLTSGAHREPIYFMAPDTPPQVPERNYRPEIANVSDHKDLGEAPPVPPRAPREVQFEEDDQIVLADRGQLSGSRRLLRTARRNFRNCFRMD